MSAGSRTARLSHSCSAAPIPEDEHHEPQPMDIPTPLRTMEKLLVETAEQSLARLVGKETEFHYQPTTARQ